MEENKLSAKQTAELLHYHVNHVYRLLALGVLHGERFGNYWLIDRGEIERAIAEQDGYGRWHHGKTAGLK